MDLYPVESACFGNAYSPENDLSAAKRFRFFSGLWTAGYPLLFTCEQLERNLRNIVIFAGINELKSFFLCVILSECLIINSVSVARWTKASTWREKRHRCLFVDIICSKMRTVFRERSSRKTVMCLVTSKINSRSLFYLVSKYRNVCKSFRLISKKLYNHSQHLISHQKLFGWSKGSMIIKYRCIIFSRYFSTISHVPFVRLFGTQD